MTRLSSYILARRCPSSLYLSLRVSCPCLMPNRAYSYSMTQVPRILRKGRNKVGTSIIASKEREPAVGQWHLFSESIHILNSHHFTLVHLIYNLRSICLISVPMATLNPGSMRSIVSFEFCVSISRPIFISPLFRILVLNLVKDNRIVL